MNFEFNYEKEKTICLTGNRPKGLPWGYNERDKRCKLLKKEAEEVFIRAINYGITTFLTGMAEGFDMIGAEILLNLRKKYKHIKIIAIIPCLNQEIKWSDSQIKRYRKILKKCDDKYALSATYTPYCMNNRNRFMVDHSSFCIACFNGLAGGTKNTIEYAKRKGVKVKILTP